MQYLLDLISAFLIGTSLMLIIFTVMLRGQEASIGASQHAAAKRGTTVLAQMIAQDLNNMGAGLGNPDTALVRLDTAGATPHRFVFWGRAHRDTTYAQRICYEWASSDTVLVNVAGVLQQQPAYHIERRTGVTNADDCTSGQLRGSSLSTVTNFRIDLHYGGTGGPVPLVGSVPDPGASRILVDVTMASPLGPNQGLGPTRWQGSFAPINVASN